MYRGIRKALTITFFCLVLWLGIQYFLPLFLPFLLGGALALAAEPMVGFLVRKLRLPRPAAAGIGVTAAFCFLTMVFLLVCALIVRELGILARQLPNLEEAVSSGMSALSGWVLGLLQRLPTGIRDIMSRHATQFFSDSSVVLDQAFAYVVDLASGILVQVPDSALVLGTGIISSYMISAKLPAMKQWVKARISTERIQRFIRGLQRLKTALFGWLRAQVKLMGITWLILTLGFLLLRVTYAPLWAALVALVDAFPVLGTGTVLLPWSLVCLLQGQSARGIGLISTYTVISLSRSILEPRLVGKQLGLDPLATLAAVYAGYKLWGLGGMIFAPILTVAAVQIARSPQPGQS